MAEIKAFRGLRYDTGKAGGLDTLACPPYDIISAEQRAGYLEKNPYNIIRLEQPIGEDCYEQAAGTLSDWLSVGILTQDADESLYVYELLFSVGGERKAVKGLITLVRLEEFSKGVILPHEETLSKAKTDRFNLLSATHCNFSQIYSLYRDEDASVFAAVDDCSQGRPDAEFTDGDGVRHRLWHVCDEAAITAFQRGFADKKLYIADGHHRYETALNYRNALRAAGTPKPGADYVCMMLVNMENDGLVVLPTHRIVRDLPSFDAAALREAYGAYFDRAEGTFAEMTAKQAAAYANGEKAYVLYTGGNRFCLLTLRDRAVMDALLPGASDAYRGLDVTVLHTLVLERILGIDKANMANQVNLTYTRDAAEAVAAVDAGTANACLLLSPTRVGEIRDVAAAGEKMPQKSTYFYPKLTTGLVLYRLW